MELLVEILVSHVPRFMNKAAQISDPVEQMKLAAVNTIANVSMDVFMGKPWNPIWGETY